MKIDFVTLPAYGHINSMLPMAIMMRELGYQVRFWTTTQFVPHIRKYGFECLPYVELDTSSLESPDMIKASRFPVLAFGQITPEIIQNWTAYKPDLVIRDIFAVWGEVAAQKLQIKSIGFCSFTVLSSRVLLGRPDLFAGLFIEFLSNLPLAMYLSWKLYQACKSLGIPFIPLTKFPQYYSRYNIVTSLKQFQLRQAVIGPEFLYVRLPHLDNHTPNDFEYLPDKFKIYIFLSTLYADAALLKSIVTQLDQSEYQLIVSTGNHNVELTTTRASLVQRQYLNQIDVLKHVDLAITTAGLNTIRECLELGVPMIAIPLMGEKKIHAGQIQKLGIGKSLNRKQVLAGYALLKITNQIAADLKAYRQKITNLVATDAARVMDANLIQEIVSGKWPVN